jgi:hypothetical protein
MYETELKYLTHYLPCRHYGGEEYSSYSFLTSAVDGGEWSAYETELSFYHLL